MALRGDWTGWCLWALASWSVLLVGGCHPAATSAAIPAGYPSSYAETIAAASAEGVVVVRSSTDSGQVARLIRDFRHRFPRVRVDYRDTSAKDIYDGVRADRAAGRAPADVLWSSAMDLQIKLVNDGYAQSYQSPEAPNVPAWANWKAQAWGITAEPIVMLYNRRLLSPRDAPASHMDFRRLLEAKGGALVGRVATYDPERSAVGYLYLSQDDAASRDVRHIMQALGTNRVRLFATTEEIIDDVAAGRSVIGYNAIGSYAVDAMRRHPDLAVVVPSDYTLIMSRIAIIPAQAPHPNAARLFLDHLLSRRGQQALARRAMSSVRGDVPPPAALRTNGAPQRAIRVGPALLVEQDAMTRRRFMTQWSKALAGETSSPPR